MKNTMIAVSMAWLLNSGLVFAESVHLPQAIEHTKAAVAHGEASNHGGVEHVPLLVSNINTALEHAKASEKVEANPHTAEGIVHLEAAVSATKQNDAKETTLHAKEALKHLELAQSPQAK
jgi:hypothetical protein